MLCMIISHQHGLIDTRTTRNKKDINLLGYDYNRATNRIGMFACQMIADFQGSSKLNHLEYQTSNHKNQVQQQLHQNFHYGINLCLLSPVVDSNGVLRVVLFTVIGGRCKRFRLFHAILDYHVARSKNEIVVKAKHFDHIFERCGGSHIVQTVFQKGF